MTDQHTRFRSLHRADAPLILVNVWDAASAAIVAAAGATAIATTSAGVSWSLGVPDGDALDREAAVGVVTRVASVVSVPVTADIETGYGAGPDDVAETVRAVAAAGAAGVNIEDSLHDGTGPLREINDQCARFAAARAAVEHLYINARVDTYLRGSGSFDETVERATAYLDAGADGVFVPGVIDPDTIAALVPAIPAPLNIMAGPGAPSVSELAKLGVARVSLGSSVAQAAYAAAEHSAAEAFSAGTYTTLVDGIDFTTLNTLLHR